MRNPLRRLTFFLLALVLALGVGLARADAARAADNAAIAINTKDGSSLFKFAFSIKKVAGDVVDQTNAAVAFSECERCQTTAIAIQIVLVTGSPSVVTPQNIALAINQNCSLCETFAGAYQVVLSTGGPVKFTPEGRRRIVEIKKEIKRLRDSDMSPFELKARLDELVGELKNVLETELVPAGPDEDEEEDLDEQVEEETPLEEPPQTATSTTAPETTTTQPPPSTTTTTTTTTTPSTTTETSTTSTTNTTTTASP
jgi:putative peptide zinc metalloprotease protein